MAAVAALGMGFAAIAAMTCFKPATADYVDDADGGRGTSDYLRDLRHRRLNVLAGRLGAVRRREPPRPADPKFGRKDGAGPLDCAGRGPDKDVMKTLTVTEARKNLSSWIRRAGAGEEIGIIDGARIYAIRPVNVVAVDYTLQEYGATPAELDAAVARTRREIAADRSAGQLTPVFPDENPPDTSRRRSARRTAGKRAR